MNVQKRIILYKQALIKYKFNYNILLTYKRDDIVRNKSSLNI